jgi:hypothetical protein
MKIDPDGHPHPNSPLGRLANVADALNEARANLAAELNVTLRPLGLIVVRLYPTIPRRKDRAR